MKDDGTVLDWFWIGEDLACLSVGCSANVLRLGVSRGILQSVPNAITGEPMYLASEIERLAGLVRRELSRNIR